jgi:hypothetical protein
VTQDSARVPHHFGEGAHYFHVVACGTPTEIDAICGAVVKTAGKHGIETPVNRICWQLVKAL